MEPDIMTIDVKETTMKARRAIRRAPDEKADPRLLPLLLLPLFGFWGCGGAQAEGPNPENGYTRVINVEVLRVQPSTFTEVVRLTGTIQANRDVMISAEEGGVVREILVDKGSRVSAGDALFRLDDDLLLAQVDQARALSAMAEETWERRKRLYEEDDVGSELVYLEAKYAAEQAAANLRLLEERLERTVITAPIAGVLDSREIEIGSMVAAGTPVARIVDANPVKITAGVPERYAADVAVGARAMVSFDVLPGEEFSGTLSYAGAAVNARNRTFPVEVVLPNPGGVIKPEMVANVSVVRRTYGEAIVVPQEALVRTEEGYIVFVVQEDGEDILVQARPVEAGPGQSNEVLIRSGLEAGERLVVVGQQSVASGDHVNIVAER
jgi:membrane fusion protein (multidrug efflux system)